MSMEKRVFKGVTLFVDEPNRYLQINDTGGDLLAPLWPDLGRSFPGFLVMLCYHGEEAPTFPADFGATLVDDCIELRLKSAPPLPPGFNAEPLGEEDFAQFSALHDGLNPDVYWTSAGIFERPDRWVIMMRKSDGVIDGYCAAMKAKTPEIFFLQAKNRADAAGLLAAVCARALAAGDSREVLFMADRGSPDFEAAVAAGFEKTGVYRGYQVVLPE